MADPVEVAIELALINRATSWAAAQSPAIAISVPNVAFTPPTVSQTAKWLRAYFLPAPTATLATASGSNQHYGLLQIDALMGAGGGEPAVARLAALVIEEFKRGTVVSRDGFTASIWKAPYRSSLMTEDAWAKISVSIPFIAFAPDPA